MSYTHPPPRSKGVAERQRLGESSTISLARCTMFLMLLPRPGLLLAAILLFAPLPALAQNTNSSPAPPQSSASRATTPPEAAARPSAPAGPRSGDAWLNSEPPPEREARRRPRVRRTHNGYYVLGIVGTSVGAAMTLCGGALLLFDHLDVDGSQGPRERDDATAGWILLGAGIPLTLGGLVLMYANRTPKIVYDTEEATQIGPHEPSRAPLPQWRQTAGQAGISRPLTIPVFLAHF